MYVNLAIICFTFNIDCCSLALVVPANETRETEDGKTIQIEYREDNGKIYKVSSFGYVR